jgi:hypothetical protein
VEADLVERTSKRRKIAELSADLRHVIQFNEQISRTSVITPELFAAAKVKRLTSSIRLL